MLLHPENHFIAKRDYFWIQAAMVVKKDYTSTQRCTCSSEFVTLFLWFVLAQWWRHETQFLSKIPYAINEEIRHYYCTSVWENHYLSLRQATMSNLHYKEISVHVFTLPKEYCVQFQFNQQNEVGLREVEQLKWLIGFSAWQYSPTYNVSEKSAINDKKRNSDWFSETTWQSFAS